MVQQSSYNLSTWESFKISMDIEFKPKYTLQSTKDKLFGPMQTSSSVQHYVMEFQNMLLESNITENEATDKFARGLKDQARAYVLLEDPLDLESMYHCARAFESATQYGRLQNTVSSNVHSPNIINDPMDRDRDRDSNTTMRQCNEVCNI